MNPILRKQSAKPEQVLLTNGVERISEVGERIIAAAENAREVLGSTMSTVEEALTSTRKSMRDGYRTLIDRSEDVLDDTRRYVKRHPVRATAIAAGAGLVVGLLLRRR